MGNSRPEYALQGVEAIVFQIDKVVVRSKNPDSAWVVVEAKILPDVNHPHRTRQLIPIPATIKGNIPSAQAGWTYKTSGSWVWDDFSKNSKYHKWVFEISRTDSALPIQATSDEAVREFFLSIPQIGDKRFKLLWDEYGSQIANALDTMGIGALERVGIKGKRAETILAQYEEKRAELVMYEMLQPANLTHAAKVRVIKTFGDRLLEEIMRDPYCTMKVDGVGFSNADGLAMSLKDDQGNPLIARDDYRRICAGIIEVLRAQASWGHCWTRLQDVFNGKNGVASLLGIADLAHIYISRYMTEFDLSQAEDAHQVSQWNQRLRERRVIESRIFVDHFGNFWLKYLYQAEQTASRRIAEIMAHPGLIDPDRANQAFTQLLEKADELELIPPDDVQEHAIRSMFRDKVSTLGGYAGSGKSTTMTWYIKACRELGLTLRAAAPTGMAANNLYRITGLHCATLHRLLGIKGDGAMPEFNADNLLPSAVYILDEVSMITIDMIAKFLDALPSNAHVVFVGDPGQLPAVGAGRVLGDIRESGVVPSYTLERVYRQSADSKILAVATGVRRSRPVDVSNASDVTFIDLPTEDDVVDWILRNYDRLIYNDQGRPDWNRVMIVDYSWKGTAGVDNINYRLQQHFHSDLDYVAGTTGWTPPNWKYQVYPGDPIIWMRNLPDYELVNGQRCTIESFFVDEDTGKVKIVLRTFNGDGESVQVIRDGAEWDAKLARAITCHKLQGGSAPIIIGVFLGGSPITKSWGYTAVTRAKEHLYAIGNPHMMWNLPDWDQRRRTMFRDELIRVIGQSHIQQAA